MKYKMEKLLNYPDLCYFYVKYVRKRPHLVLDEIILQSEFKEEYIEFLKKNSLDEFMI